MANAASTKQVVAAADLGPAVGNAADQGDFAASLGRNAHTLHGVNDGRGANAADRLRVYRNNVIVALSEALRTSYPVTERLLGEEFFHNAAVAYAMAEKPTSPVMSMYGANFPDFLAALPGVAPYPFVPEAARIERAQIDATNAADAAPLALDALSEIAPDALFGISFAAHPATHIVPCPQGGYGAWCANQARPVPPADADAALITRPHLEVGVHPLSGPAAAFAHTLIAGAPLGDAAQNTDDGLDLPATLALLISAGAFSAVHVAG